MIERSHESASKWSDRTVLLICLSIALVLSVAPALVSLTLPLPDLVATHWGMNGQPDDWQPVTTAVITHALIVFITTSGLTLLGSALNSTALLGAFAVGTGTFTTATLNGTLWTQTGDSMPPIGLVLIAALLLGSATGLTAGLTFRQKAQPTSRAEGSRPRATEPWQLSNTAALAWTGRVKVSRGVVVFAVTVTLLSLAPAVFMLTDPWMGVFFALIGLAMACGFATLAARVTIDARGVRVGAFGIVFITVGIHEITAVGTRHVEALGELGGWGYRVAHDGTAVAFASASGQGLVLGRGERKDMIIVLDDDDIEVAARTVSTLRERVAQG